MADRSAGDMPALPCALCDQPMPREPAKRCLTDCSHEFCLACLCRRLGARKNRCPVCNAVVRTVHQLQSSQTSAAPARVRFCNATYVLNVSIWDVQDPARVLASLFHLEHARLIHQGKLLKRGDVWPGSVVQLFGTPQGGGGDGTGGVVWTSINVGKAWLEWVWSRRAREILCCPCSVLVDFVRSLFGQVDGQHDRQGYARLATAEAGTAGPSRFHEPGRVAAPDYTDSL